MATRIQIANLRKRLVKVATSKYPRVAYSAIDHIVGLNVAIPYHRQVLGGILADIGAAERASGRPFLPGVVVRKHSGRPGPGFYKEVKARYPTYRGITPDYRIHDAVLKKIVACPGW
jgi:hypothetical protein